MNESEYQHLREQSWRRKLTAEEEARLDDYLLAEPQAQAEWEADVSLTHLLSQLPPAPIASNFTAQVMQAIERETSAGAHLDKKPLAFWTWLQRRGPRIAWAAFPAVAVLLSYAVYQVRQIRQTDLAESVVRVSTVASVVKPDVFKDFEAIALLSQAPVDDSDLVAALK